MAKKKQRRTKSSATGSNKEPSLRQVPRHEQQYALVGDTLLDVENAFRLLRTMPRRTKPIDVTAWARLYGMDGNPHSPVQLGPAFDRAHAMSTNLARPLILATFASGPIEAEDTLLIIDGTHRLYRAFVEGRDQLPALVLTAAETSAITMARPTR
ncbi:hypothetical protein Caci_6862 [Catenulispora acidiphila DSM 44928]|uniref:ParB/Sulfiredoxin domain-containing protein n=1 Tax=Catenulispora acidiphila (strain DSM 44928 / JCM 14897 / NBRC 102108 / NRRL B-24433 / ID139908) TaxID=479433 RepID=C7Q3D7_CATAD|nr:hypothetical protein [Catenulispora acidiphila]ACU75702.1 hypothetical protein Caci_6862 [Catenulispora acidiphila DSM 44928]